MRTSQVLLLIYLAIGIAAVTGATLAILETRSFLADAASAQGVVVAHERHSFLPPWMIGDGDPTYRSRRITTVPVFEFADGNGRAHRVVGTSPLPGREIGEKVTVFYSPEDPEHAQIDSTLDLWGGTLALMGVGLAFTAGCVFALIGPDRRRIDPPSRFQ